MLSKNQAKLIRSLEQKKNREREKLFVAEGPKVVGDLLQAGYKARILLDDEEDVRKVSFLQHPQGVLAVFEIPDTAPFTIGQKELASTDYLPSQGRTGGIPLSLALDGIQDPGNLGTIIRIADWFGIETIYCSKGTADVYNPKVIQATMGSIARVNIVYTDLAALIDSLPEGTPVYGTLLDGENIYEQPLSAHGLIIMGNEGNGISSEIRKKITHKLLIPNFNTNPNSADSLNVAIATAITCSEIKAPPRPLPKGGETCP